MLTFNGYTVVIGRYQDVMFIAEILETGDNFIGYTYESVREQTTEYIERLVLNEKGVR